VLDALPLQVVIALASAARSQRIREQMVQYLKRWRSVKPKITGDDLLRLGFAEGAALGAALRAARDAQLDGKATTRKQQMLVALARLASAGI
jgi:tRNA nucleotidyltransferase (CCA-adding enzyme)